MKKLKKSKKSKKKTIVKKTSKKTKERVVRGAEVPRGSFFLPPHSVVGFFSFLRLLLVIREEAVQNEKTLSHGKAWRMDDLRVFQRQRHRRIRLGPQRDFEGRIEE